MIRWDPRGLHPKNFVKVFSPKCGLSERLFGQPADLLSSMDSSDVIPADEALFYFQLLYTLQRTFFVRLALSYGERD